MPDIPRDPTSETESEDLLGLEGFSEPDENTGLSLESLSAAYAELIDGGAIPYESEVGGSEAEPEDDQDEELADAVSTDADRDCEVSPRSILEAMLFVGNTENKSLTSQQVASLMRGVRPHEVDQLIVELNDEYRRLGCPFSITSVGAGYVMQLDESHRRLRDKFYRRVRDARLSQAAIDVLAIVAYRQPLTREEIDRLRGRPSSGVLAQLVRRQLLRQARPADQPRRPNYHTTDRFLNLFGLSHLEELPQSQEIEGDS